MSHEQTLEEFLAAYDPHRFERPSVTVDIALFTAVDGALKLLLIRRGNHPNIGCYALPGGFIDMHETLEQAARRELFEETNQNVSKLYPLGFFGEPTRDPRLRIITAGFGAFVSREALTLRAGDDAAAASMFSISLNCGEEVAIPERAQCGNQITLPCSADGILPAYGKSVILTLSDDTQTQTSHLAVCREHDATTPVLLKSELASDHALIILHALINMHALREHVKISD